MLTNNHQARTMVAADLSTVLSVLERVENLPKWTRFYRSVGARHGHKYAVTTVVGPAETWIEAGGYGRARHVDICSHLHGRTEKARVMLIPGDGRTEVTLSIGLPADWPEERVSAQRKVMEQELQDLDALCMSLEAGVDLDAPYQRSSIAPEQPSPFTTQSESDAVQP